MKYQIFHQIADGSAHLQVEIFALVPFRQTWITILNLLGNEFCDESTFQLDWGIKKN